VDTLTPEEPAMAAPEDVPESPSAEATAALTDLSTALAVWRRTHPEATFAEIEAAVETHLARLRAQLIVDALPPAGVAPPEAERRPTCAACGVGLVRRGRHRRTLRVVGDAPVTLERAYWSCPRCGAGLFPPR
jgi:hypothetical protein